MAVHPAVTNTHFHTGERLQFASQWPVKPQQYYSHSVGGDTRSPRPAIYTNNPGINYPQHHHQQQMPYISKPPTLSLTNIPFLGMIPQGMPQPQFYSHETLVPIPKRAEHVSKPRSTTARNAMNHPLGSQRQSHSIQSSNQYQSRKSLGYLPQHHSHYQQQQILPPIIVPIQMPVPLPSHQHSAISRPAYNMPAPIHHPHSQHATMPHCAPIRGATQVQRLAQQTIFEVPQSLVDSIISSFKSRLEPLQEMQYKHMKNPHTASPNHTDPSLAYPDLATFVSRFLADNRIPVMVLAHTLIYLDRFSKRLTKRSTACQSAPHLTFLAAILVATKYCDDLCMMTSRDISRQFNGLFSIQDVSRIERSFMSIIKYKLYVEPKELDPILRKHHIDKKKLLAATHVAPP